MIRKTVLVSEASPKSKFEAKSNPNRFLPIMSLFDIIFCSEIILDYWIMC
jgi:hypothetical protein